MFTFIRIIINGNITMCLIVYRMLYFSTVRHNQGYILRVVFIARQNDLPSFLVVLLRLLKDTVLAELLA